VRHECSFVCLPHGQQERRFQQEGGSAGVDTRVSNRGSEQVLYQVMLNGPAGSRTARSNAQLAVDRAHMGVDGKQTQDELFGDLGAGQSLCQQA
jgi:hypothetical protein